MGQAAPQTTVVEASPLISFLNVDRFDIVETLGGAFVCTSHVRAEVVRFRQQARLNDLLAARRITEVDLDAPVWLAEFARLIDETPLGAGEASSVLYAQCHQCPLIITDRKGIREARRRGVTCLTTEDVMLRAIAQQYMTEEEADQLLAAWAVLDEFPMSRTSFRKPAGP
jgi:predicted nucleic acid-binding protein